MYWRGNDAAGDLFGELEAFAARARLDVEHHVAELAVAARLLLVPAANLRARRGSSPCRAPAAPAARPPRRTCAAAAPSIRAGASRPGRAAASGACRRSSRRAATDPPRSAWPSADVSFTSSLRSLRPSPVANTGGGAGGPLACTAPPFSALMVSPDLMAIETTQRNGIAGLGRRRASPAPRRANANTPAARSSRPSTPVTTVPSPNSPVSTRTSESLPPCAVCSDFIT